MQPTQIKPNVYWVGAVDWNIREFHGYSTPRGTTYNAFLVNDDRITLFDTVKGPFRTELLRHVEKIVDPRKIDYIVVNHVEMDHSGSLPEVVEAVEPEKVFCSAKGAKALVEHFGAADWPLEVVRAGDTVSLGKKTVSFIPTPMLHWPDSMMSYIAEDRLLISQDGFGQHWATSERFDDEVEPGELMYQSAKYYANILLPYSKLIQNLLAQVRSMGLEIDMIAPDHGLIWRSQVAEIVDAYDRWSRQVGTNKALVVYDTMWHSTEMMARAAADGLSERGASVHVMSLEATHRADVMTELLDAKAVLLGSPTLNNGILPRMADVLCYMKGLRPADKIGAAFGSYGWGGESVKLLNAAMEDMDFNVVDPGVRANYVPNDDDLEQCRALGAKVGEMLTQ